MRYEINVALLSEEGKELYKKVICEELWLNYYNSTLRRHKVITEREYLNMHEVILKRKNQLLREIHKESICENLPQSIS